MYRTPRVPLLRQGPKTPKATSVFRVTGDGWRTDATLDMLWNNGMSATGTDPAAAGEYSLNLRSTIALANVYYDFGLG